MSSSPPTSSLPATSPPVSQDCSAPQRSSTLTNPQYLPRVDLNTLPPHTPIPVFLDLGPGREDPDHRLLARYLQQQSAELVRLRESIIGGLPAVGTARAQESPRREPNLSPEQDSEYSRLTRTIDNLAALVDMISERQRLVGSVERLEEAMVELRLAM